MPENTEFARLVSLACHDLRTPLATVYGFARTLTRGASLPEPAGRYVEMIEAASQQLSGLLDDLGLVARIEGGRYEPVAHECDTVELAQAAAGRAGEKVTASGGAGATGRDRRRAGRALPWPGFAVAAHRHGGVPSVDIAVAGREFRIGPVQPAAAPVLLAEELKDLGAAVALRVLDALGARVAIEDGALVVRLA